MPGLSKPSAVAKIPAPSAPTETASLCLSEPAFCAWVARARFGDRLVYHRGFLALDRVPSTSPLSAQNRTALVAIASRAFKAKEDGRVLLIQDRRGPDDTLYIAIAIPACSRPSCTARHQRLCQAEDPAVVAGRSAAHKAMVVPAPALVAEVV